MTFKEAIEFGYLHRQGRYKGAPWICNGRQYPTWREALDAANASLAAHAPAPEKHNVVIPTANR